MAQLRAASLPEFMAGDIMQPNHRLRQIQTHLQCLQVTTYPNGSILVAANGSAVLTSSNATSNTSSAGDVFGTQPLERYLGKAALCSMHGHAFTNRCSVDREVIVHHARLQRSCVLCAYPAC